MSARNIFISFMLAILAAVPALAQSNPATVFSRRQAPRAVEHGKVLEKDGRVMLYGGENPAWNFDISNFKLDTLKLLNGVGREYYQALIAPQFVPAAQTREWLTDESRVLIVHFGDETHAYPVSVMIRHIAVNDVVGGVPVLPVYCTHARMGAVFDRRIGGHAFTFGVSGYTYADPDIRDGLEVFVLWDRETESLWWPPLGEAVSGPLAGRTLPRVDIPHWADTTWGEARQKYPGITVLAPGQTQQPPENWPHLSEDELKALQADSTAF